MLGNVYSNHIVKMKMASIPKWSAFVSSWIYLLLPFLLVSWGPYQHGSAGEYQVTLIVGVEVVAVVVAAVVAAVVARS